MSATNNFINENIEGYNDSNGFPQDIVLIAHGLGSIHGKTYTNCLEALEYNYRLGFRVFETDLALTSDGELAARHDWLEYWYTMFDQRIDPEKIGKPLSANEFKGLKMYGYLTPLTFSDITSIMSIHKDIYIITDTKSLDAAEIADQFKTLVRVSKDTDPDILKRIIPQIYNEKMFSVINSIYNFNSFIYTLYQTSASDDEVIDFAQKGNIRIITMPEARVRESLVQRLSSLGISTYVHTVNSMLMLEEYKRIGIKGFYTDFITPDYIKYYIEKNGDMSMAEKNGPLQYAFGDSLVLSSCEPIVTDVMQGQQIEFEITWIFKKPFPENKLISYYIGNKQAPYMAYNDTDRLQASGIFFKDIKLNEPVSDRVKIQVPGMANPGQYEVSVFVYPVDGYELLGIYHSSVHPNQKRLFDITIKEQPDLTKRFLHMKTDNNKNFYEAVVAYNLPNIDNPNMEKWLGYALSTNERGRLTADMLEKYTSIKGKSCIDAGCAYGGFLVALAERGANVSGFDISDELITLAKANFKDVGINPPIYVKDVTNTKDVSCFFNTMDIVTCNDVIEHVKNPEKAVQNIGMMLKPGGYTFFHIPNKNYPGLILKDDHYSLFGITLLDYEDAAMYYSFKQPRGVCDVYYYLELEQYKKLFNEAGLTFDIIEESFAHYTRKQVVNYIYYLKNANETLIGDLPSGIKNKLSQRLNIYISKALNDINTMDETQFRYHYGTPIWSIIGRKI